MDPNSRLVALGAAGATGAAAEVLGVEDVFSTWLYTGNGSTQTITNGIDLAGEGGLVWIKQRNGTDLHALVDSERPSQNVLFTNSIGGQSFSSLYPTLGSSGFSLPSFTLNLSNDTYASWTFRKAPKFFDVVTYTGTGANRTIAHNLGSVPGCIIVKRTDTTGDWQVYHRANTANPETDYLVLNSTAATADSNTRWNDTAPTSSEFTVGTEATVNASGGTYVAYLFAHDAGGFGDDGTESVIKCGSYTGNGSASGPVVDLGWEPQWVLIKRTDNTANWYVYDTMRGMPVGGTDYALFPNLNNAETNADFVDPSATGFSITATSVNVNASGGTYIYIAIRRGPMKTPTDATTVFNVATTTTSRTTNAIFDTNLNPCDLYWYKNLDSSLGTRAAARLTGFTQLDTSSTGAEATSYLNQSGKQDKFIYTGNFDSSSEEYANYYFRRAPGFFDVVAYTGTGSARTVAHNLGVAPELMIVKRRSGTEGWQVYSGPTEPNNCLELNKTTQAVDRTGTSERWSSAPTSTDINLATHVSVNGSGDTYIAYLFATLAGISKIGSYTGTGTTLQIDCGFASGARFVLIKRTDSTGSWYVWDTARGITSSSDPYLLLNSTAAEVTGTDYIDPYSAGFEISSSAPAAINASGGSFIFLAIA